MRPGPTLASFTQQLQASQELPPRIVTLGEHRCVFSPIIVIENQERSFITILLLVYLIFRFRRRTQERFSVAGLKFERNNSPYPFVGS